MASKPSNQKPSWQQGIKAPLVFSFVMGIIAAVVASISATGGTDEALRVDIGLLAFGIAFVATLLVVSVLMMASKENPPGLSEGSGVNRSSARPDRKKPGQGQ